LGVEIKQAVVEALEHRLFPVMARWLAEAGVSVQEAIDLLRAAAIEEARKCIPKGVNRDSISFISHRTAISRRVVRQTLAGTKTPGKSGAAAGHRGERVLAGWWHDPDFRDHHGHPRILPLSKGRHSFEELVRRYSGERQYRTLLMDFKQVGAVKVLDPGDRVQVLRQSYADVGWTEAGQAAMAEQLAEHIETCLHNFKHPEGSQYWACRRVANTAVRPAYSKILLRDLRKQIDGHAHDYYDMLTHPQHTADPADPQAEQISVTYYIHRKLVSPPNRLEGADLIEREADSDAAIAAADDVSADQKRPKPPAKPRGKAKARK
jgi:hypothetical protein